MTTNEIKKEISTVPSEYEYIVKTFHNPLRVDNSVQDMEIYGITSDDQLRMIKEKLVKLGAKRFYHMKNFGSIVLRFAIKK